MKKLLIIIAVMIMMCVDLTSSKAQIITGSSRFVGQLPSLDVNGEADAYLHSDSYLRPKRAYSVPYQDEHFFGDWGGIQPILLDRGVHVFAHLHEEADGNFHGGWRKGATDAGEVGVEFDVDWKKLTRNNFFKNFWTHTLIVNGHGQNMSTKYLHDGIAGVQKIYGFRGDVALHLVYMYGEQSLMKDHLILNAGWIPPGTFFAASPLFCMYMSVGMCGNPSPGKYLPGNRDWPSGNLSFVARFRPTKETYIMSGAFAVSPHTYNGGRSGWAWAQDGLGKFSTPIEVGWLPKFGKHQLQGHYKFGYDYDNSSYPDLYSDIYGQPWVLTHNPKRRRAGQNIMWFIADQMLVRHGDGPTNGLIALGGWMWADGKTSAMSDHAWGGLVESGSAWGRPLDSIGVLYQWFHMSRTSRRQQEVAYNAGKAFPQNQWGPVWGIQSHESVYELFYNAHMTPGISIQPDFQYINRPGATTRYHDAATFGLQFNALL